MSRRGEFVSIVATAMAVMMLAGVSAGQAAPTGAKAASTEEAIAKGLDFLRTHQAKDGAFRSGEANLPMDIGVTSLAMEAMAEAPKRERKQDEERIAKAAEFLLAHQEKDGGIRGEMIGTYTTSIAVTALKATGDRKYKKAIEEAVAYLRAQQCNAGSGFDAKKDAAFGGFGYGGTKGRADLSNTQMVLDAFEAAGLKKDDPAYKDAVTFISRCQNNNETNDQTWAGTDGGGVYTPNGSRDTEYTKPDGTKGYHSYGSMTYALLKSMIYAKMKKDDPRVKAAVGWIRENYTLDENPGMGKSGLYYYYHTLATALGAYDEDEITDAKGVKHEWRIELARKMIELQRADGSWMNEQKDRWNENDPVLVTAYAIKILEETAKK